MVVKSLHFGNKVFDFSTRCIWSKEDWILLEARHT